MTIPCHIRIEEVPDGFDVSCACGWEVAGLEDRDAVDEYVSAHLDTDNEAS